TDRDGDLVAVEEPGEPPDPGPAAVLEVGFRAQIPDLGADLVGVLPPGVVPAVAVRQGVLAARLVVDDDVDDERGTTWPLHPRWVAAVPDEVPGRPRGHRLPRPGGLAGPVLR